MQRNWFNLIEEDSFLKKKNQNRIWELALVVTAAIWGGAFVALKDGLNYFGPFTLMALRFFIAAVVMYAFMWKKIGRVKVLDIKYGVILGLISCAAFGAQNVGLLYTTVSKQGLFTGLYVIFTPFLVWVLYKNAPDIRIFFSAFMAIIGIGFMSLESIGSFDLNIGDMLTIFSAVMYAFMIIFVDKALYKTDAIKLTFLQLPFSALFLGVLAFFTEDFPKELPLYSWYSLIYLGIFATFICYLLQISAQKYTAPSRASLLMSLESLFAVLFAVLFLGEKLSHFQLIGIAMMFSALILVEFAPRKKPSLKEAEVASEPLPQE